MLAPKGAAFLYTRPEKQSLVEPLVVSWGWGQNSTYKTGSTFIDYLEWIGTKDPSVYLSVPAAIHFQAENDWPTVRQRCHELARETMHRICNLTGLARPYPDSEDFFAQMAIAPLPEIADLSAFKKRLYDEHRIEIPCISWNQHQYIRFSFQAYNHHRDADALLKALTTMLH
jgi:isopenicillin-N epimerase